MCSPTSPSFFTGSAATMQLKLSTSTCDGVAGPCTEVNDAFNGLKQSALDAAKLFVDNFANDLDIPESVVLGVNALSADDIPTVCDSSNSNTDGLLNCRDLICNNLMGGILPMTMGVTLNEQGLAQGKLAALIASLLGAPAQEAEAMADAVMQAADALLYDPQQLMTQHKQVVAQAMDAFLSPRGLNALLQLASPAAGRRLAALPLLKAVDGYKPLNTYTADGYNAYSIGCAGFKNCPGANPIAVGIGIAVAVGVLLLCCVAWICFRGRGKKSRGPPAEQEGIYMSM